MNNIRIIILKIRWKLIKLARKYGFNLKIAINIPSAFITGSVGKTTTCRMLAAILAENGKVVGLSTTQGIYIGKETIRVGDSSNCKFASRLLIDKRVQTGVFELARGGLLEQGIAFNGCDVGAVLNVYDNHLGLGGINTREDMANVKSAVVMSARKMAVINADDLLCLAMRDHVVATDTCLVSMLSDNPGRMNFYEHLPFKLLITWADGAQALAELAHFIQGMNFSGKKYLMFCSMGNRPDQYIKDMGKSVAGFFTHYICSDHDDLRGRPPREAAEWLSEGLIENGVSRKNITIASSHQNGLEIALNKPSINDLLVVCTYAFDAARKEVLLKEN